jgi:acetyltransferase-like isoleucine patch superfamily enzyme
MGRDVLKWLAFAIARCLVLPRLVGYWLGAAVLGRDRALEGATQRLASIPGVRGHYLRRAFLASVLKRCDRSATVSWGPVVSKCGAEIHDGVYVGAGCHLGFVVLERDVLLASGVHVTSGARTHGTSDATVPIREQAGLVSCVRIGRGTWVGSAAVVMADVGSDCVVGAGAVVNKPLPDGVVAAGVPARVIRRRSAS